MAPDPQGTRPAGSTEVGEPDPVTPYDRSSLRGEFLVMIPGQTEEDYLRRHPPDRKCEFIDGTVYLHTTAIDETDPAEFYDRSSLPDDFMVMIPYQTEEEYLRKAPKYPFCEFIDGVVYMHAAVSTRHQFDSQFLMFLLMGYTAIRDAGIVLSGPAVLRVRPDGCIEPDIFVLPPGGQSQVHDLTCDPPANLIVEVLSPSTRSHDLKAKSALYHEAGTGEVWFIDHRDRVVIVERRTPAGIDSRRVESGPIRSGSIPGFWIDAGWLWADPRPNPMQCLDQILAGPPPE